MVRRKGTPRKSREQLDAEYRRALGLEPVRRPEEGPRLPSQIGTQSSAGGARGGRGAANKGRGRNS